MSGETFDPFNKLNGIKIPTLPGHYSIRIYKYMSNFEKKHWTYRCQVQSYDRFMLMKGQKSDYYINYTFFTIHAEESGVDDMYSYKLQSFFNTGDPSTQQIHDTELVASVQATLEDINLYISNMLQRSETFVNISQNITGVHLLDSHINDRYYLIANVTFPIVPGYAWVMKMFYLNRLMLGLNALSTGKHDSIQIPILTIIPQTGSLQGRHIVRTPDDRQQLEFAGNSVKSICQAVVDLYTERMVNAAKAETSLVTVSDRRVLFALSKLTDIVDHCVSSKYAINL